MEEEALVNTELDLNFDFDELFSQIGCRKPINLHGK